jgi:D-lyxose ketol-isomerase
MKLKSIKKVGKKKVYDITVAGNHEYVLSNGLVVSNTGITYSADNIWIIGRQQDKDGTEIQGYHFVINVEKSRFVKEKSKIPISVSWNGGIQKWSGLLQVALNGGYVVKPKNGWYTAFNPETKEELTGNLREAQTMTKDFWETIFTKTKFAKYIEDTFQIGQREMLTESVVEDVVELETTEQNA